MQTITTATPLLQLQLTLIKIRPLRTFYNPYLDNTAKRGASERLKIGLYTKVQVRAYQVEGYNCAHHVRDF